MRQDKKNSFNIFLLSLSFITINCLLNSSSQVFSAPSGVKESEKIKKEGMGDAVVLNAEFQDNSKSSNLSEFSQLNAENDKKNTEEIRNNLQPLKDVNDASVEGMSSKDFVQKA